MKLISLTYRPKKDKYRFVFSNNGEKIIKRSNRAEDLESLLNDNNKHE